MKGRESIQFEYDPLKNDTNYGKHGINFQQARQLWVDSDRIEGTHWAAVITYRNGNIRLISVRRARREEVDFYEDQ